MQHIQLLVRMMLGINCHTFYRLHNRPDHSSSDIYNLRIYLCLDLEYILVHILYKMVLFDVPHSTLSWCIYVWFHSYTNTHCSHRYNLNNDQCHNPQSQSMSILHQITLDLFVDLLYFHHIQMIRRHRLNTTKYHLDSTQNLQNILAVLQDRNTMLLMLDTLEIDNCSLYLLQRRNHQDTFSYLPYK